MLSPSTTNKSLVEPKYTWILTLLDALVQYESKNNLNNKIDTSVAINIVAQVLSCCRHPQPDAVAKNVVYHPNGTETKFINFFDFVQKMKFNIKLKRQIDIAEEHRAATKLTAAKLVEDKSIEKVLVEDKPIEEKQTEDELIEKKLVEDKSTEENPIEEKLEPPTPCQMDI